MTLTHHGNGSTDPEKIIAQSIKDSAQVPPNVTRDGIVSGGGAFGFSYPARGSILPAWGTRQREFALRDMYRSDEMNLIRGAFTGIAKMIASLPWEIKGDEEEDAVYGRMAASQGWRLRRNNGVEYFQEVFRQANFGAGWGEMITQGVLNFLRYDTGWFLEVIAAGDAYDRPFTAITGLSNLDTLRTYPTGDPRYPAVYYDRYGGLHVFNQARVIRLCDMVDGDEMHPGYGDCALSRSISIAVQERWIQRYITMRLDDVPPPGVSIFGGVIQAQWDAKIMQYRSQQTTDQKPVFGDRLNYFSPDPQYMPKIENYDFSQAPELFDYRKYTDINVDRLANAIGVDRQEIMALVSGGLGSGAQSNILSQKGKGKTIGFLKQQIERRLNDVLPENFTFGFKDRDGQEALENAQKDNMVATTAATLASSLSPKAIEIYLANESESFRDAIDAAPRANDVFNAPYQPVIAEDNAPGVNPASNDTAQLPQGKPPNVNVNEDIEDEIKSVQKDYSTTQALFIQDVTDLLKSASVPNPYLDRRAFSVVMRSFLKNYGTQAYKDGMAAGGVYVETLDTEDNLDNARVFMDQSQYIAGLAEDVYTAKAVSPANANARAQMWGKSLQMFNDAGMYSANRNGMFLWRMNPLKENCKTCLRMNGQVHRLKTYKARGILPRAKVLACGGWLCGCELIRTTELARGRF